MRIRIYMRLLQLHSDFIEYEPIEKEIRDAEEIVPQSKVRLEDLVVAFVAVENRDDESFAKGSINQVYRAPFGWTKSFNIKVKGHPLAENSREISKQEEHKHADPLHREKESSALQDEEKLQSLWYIAQPGGQMAPVHKYNFKKQDQNLQMLVDYEIAKNRAVNEQPAHVRLMKKLAIADYE